VNAPGPEGAAEVAAAEPRATQHVRAGGAVRFLHAGEAVARLAERARLAQRSGTAVAGTGAVGRLAGALAGRFRVAEDLRAKGGAGAVATRPARRRARAAAHHRQGGGPERAPPTP